jgi:hypothetical protein
MITASLSDKRKESWAGETPGISLRRETFSFRVS